MIVIRTKDLILILMMMCFLVLYVYILSINSMSEVDMWVYDKIFHYTLLTIIVLIILSYVLSFSLLARVLFVSILIAFIHIITPTIKYGFNIYNPFDTLSHIIFMTFISEHGRIPYNEEVYYARLYGYIPLGNGVLPTIINVVAQFNSFQTYLIVFIVFMILLLLSFFTVVSEIPLGNQHDFLKHEINFNYHLNTVRPYALFVLIISLIYFPEWFGSPVFAFIPLSFLASLIVKDIYMKRRIGRKNIIVYMMLFLYATLSHLSTSLYLLLFLTFTCISSLSITIMNIMVTNRTQKHCKNHYNIAIKTILMMCATFVIFSLLQHLYYNFAARWYIDYYYSKIFEGEFETPMEFGSFYRNPDIPRAFLFLVGAYGKLALNVIIQLILIIVGLIKIFKSKFSIGCLDTFLISLVFSSNALLVLTYLTFFKRFEDLTRQVVFVEVVILTVLYYYANKKIHLMERLRAPKISSINLIILLLVSIMASLLTTFNYGLPQVIQPTCVNDETCFRSIIRTYVITFHAISSAEFVRESISKEYKFTTLITNIFPINYIDLFWDKVAKQELTIDIYYPENVGQTIKKILLDKQNLLLFMPQSFKYVPVGLLDFDKPLKVINAICSRSMNVVYNNGGVYVYVK